MAKINAINNKSEELTIDPGSSGDSFIQFDINTTGEFRIGVDDTDDSFRISQGSALGTNDTFIMTDTGERTMPLQPAFSAYNSVTDSNVTGGGTIYTLIYDTEVFDQNGDFDGTSTFTAPVTGRYWLGTNIECDGITSSETSGFITIVTSNRSYQVNQKNVYAASTSGNYQFHSESIIDMDAADTVTITIRILGGTDVVDVLGGGDMLTSFFGYLAV